MIFPVVRGWVLGRRIKTLLCSCTQHTCGNGTSKKAEVLSFQKIPHMSSFVLNNLKTWWCNIGPAEWSTGYLAVDCVGLLQQAYE